MKRVAIIGPSPYISDYYRKNATALFAETGGNTGNLAFEYAVATQISEHSFSTHWGIDPADLRSRADIIVLPLANQLGIHTDLGSLAARLKAFDLPVIGVGLGAQSSANNEDVTLTPGTQKWLELMVAMSPTSKPNIGVRGQFTKDQAARFGAGDACAVTGCPSNFINLLGHFPEVIAQKSALIPGYIAVNAGIPHRQDLKELERSLALLVTQCGGSYIVQHGMEMIQLAMREFDLMKPQTLELCRDYIRPDLAKEEFEAWCKRFAIALYDARAWMEFVRRFDFVIGTRFHGAMFAIQAGTPAGCIAHDSRTYEMCETMAIPVILSHDVKLPLTLEAIPSYFAFDSKAYVQKRLSLLRRYVEIFEDADVEVNPRLKAYAVQAGA